MRAALAPCLLLAACASAGPVDPGAVDRHDLAAAVDQAFPLFDLAGFGDAGCALGTPDHCGSCSTKCAGPDDATTARVCSGPTALGACGLLCKGEAYDVDALLDDGCEIDDPLQDTAATAFAVVLPDLAPSGQACNNSNNGCTVVRAVASDARKHDAAPVDRPLGREDWFVVTATGPGGSNPMTACLSISNANWPSDNKYEACISPTSGSQSPTVCATAIARMGSACVAPNGNPSSGTFYVRVRKLMGAPTALGYALYLEH